MIFPLVAILGASGSGCGGADGPRPATELQEINPTATGGVDCAATARLSKTSLLDDFEGGNTDKWYFFNDKTPDVVQTAAAAPSPRCNSQVALHVQGGKFADYGGGFEIALPDPPFDASQFTGIGAWLRKGDDATALDSIYLNVRDRFVDGGAANKVDPSLWGVEVCDPNPTAKDKTQCGDTYGASLGLGREWTFVRAPFAKMKQGGWGFPAQMDKSALYAVKFAYYGNSEPGKGTSIDVWVDDVLFYATGTE